MGERLIELSLSGDGNYPWGVYGLFSDVVFANFISVTQPPFDLFAIFKFLQLPGKRGHGEKGWAIQAKIEIRLWLGLMNRYPTGEYINDAPGGFETVNL